MNIKASDIPKELRYELGIKVRNKYGAKRTEYKGRTYDSKAEANRAAELDADPDVTSWTPQVPVQLVHGFTFRVDFIVYKADGAHHYEDVTGVVTKRKRTVIKLWKQHGPAELWIVTKDGIEVIENETTRD